MAGISGATGLNSMPRNCGMEGMHGNNTAIKTNNTLIKQSVPELSANDGIRGQKIDLRV